MLRLGVLPRLMLGVLPRLMLERCKDEKLSEHTQPAGCEDRVGMFTSKLLLASVRRCFLTLCNPDFECDSVYVIARVSSICFLSHRKCGC